MVYALSNMGTTSPQELVDAVPEGRKWFQLYVMQNREASMKIINQAKSAGFEALIMTVDTPVAGLRYRDMRNGLTIPPRIRLKTVLAIATKPIWWINLFSTGKLEFASYRNWNRPMQELAGLIFDPSIALEDIKWLRSVWDGPIIIKGIQSVEDAKAVSALGIEGIIVSNHGGRQFDRGPVPVEILPDVVAAQRPVCTAGLDRRTPSVAGPAVCAVRRLDTAARAVSPIQRDSRPSSLKKACMAIQERLSAFSL